MPADEAYPVLSLMLAEERTVGSAALRAAALEALGRTEHPDAAGLLVFYLLNDADGSVRVAAGEALAALGSDAARFQLVRALTEGQPDPQRRARLLDVLGHFEGEVVREVLASYLEDPDVRPAAVAALRLADHNDATAVPYLIELVRSGAPADAQAAVIALENVTSLRLDVQGHELIAEQYEQWYATARATAAREPDRAWFRDALRRRGYDVGPLTPYVAGEAAPVSVPVLVRALRDEEAVLRRNAAVALRRVTGLTFGDVGRGTSAREASRIADRWARWWDRVQGER
jgi:HEAT repeat protein